MVSEGVDQVSRLVRQVNTACLRTNEKERKILQNLHIYDFVEKYTNASQNVYRGTLTGSCCYSGDIWSCLILSITPYIFITKPDIVKNFTENNQFAFWTFVSQKFIESNIFNHSLLTLFPPYALSKYFVFYNTISMTL